MMFVNNIVIGGSHYGHSNAILSLIPLLIPGIILDHVEDSTAPPVAVRQVSISVSVSPMPHGAQILWIFHLEQYLGV